MMLGEGLFDVEAPGRLETHPWVVGDHLSGWCSTQAGIWTNLTCRKLPRFGWKVHVSSTIDNAPTVLETISNIAFEHGCSFKHLRGRDSFLTLHFKNASRLQSGKFIALYPDTEELAYIILKNSDKAIGSYVGLDILTDRSYKKSSSVFYRWGAFTKTGRINAEGAAEELVPNGQGRMVPDLRLPYFALPEGIIDPFLDEGNFAASPSTPQHVLLDQFKINKVLRFTNAGGRYTGKCQVSGAEVMIKEARPGTGFVGNESAIQRLHREVAVMVHVNSRFQDMAPSVFKTFTVQGHEYVAMEYLPGTPLSEWIARENPLYSCLHNSRHHVREYIGRASKILATIWSNLGKLHEIGIAYGDLSLGNIIIGELDNARFIDFESCTSTDDTVLGLRTPDFCLLSQIGEVPARDRDIYAYHCVAVSLILRLTSLAEISDHVLDDITADLILYLGQIPDWWYQACNHLKSTSRKHSPYKVLGFQPPKIDDVASRHDLRTRLSNAVLDSYMPRTECLFPTGAAAREGAFLSFSFGCSSLLTALHSNGIEISEEIRSDFSRAVEQSLDARLLPTNYNVGVAGLIESCSVLALNELSARLLGSMARDWSTVSDPGLSNGLTGISLAFLRSGNVALAEEVMTKAIQLAQNYQWKKNGLMYGRAGVVAGACRFSSLLRLRPSLGIILIQLIEEEFGQTVRHPKGNSLSLKGEVDGSRLLPYLCDGTAGLLLASMLAHDEEHIDFRLDPEKVVSLASDLGTPFMLEGSLMDGAAGLALVLELSRLRFPSLLDRIPEPGWRRIEKFLLPLKSGIGVFHPRTLKFDLSHAQGSIGILEALLWLDGLADINISGLYLSARSPPVHAF